MSPLQLLLAIFVVLLTFLCSSGPAVAQTPLTIDRDLLDAIRQVESRGNSCAIGDGGRSYGAYQIMEPYYSDALQFNPSLADNGRMFSDVWGMGSEAYSEQVIMSYMGRYATPARLGRQPTNEDIARIHNGGPNGYMRDSTLPYWERVMEELQRQQRSGRQVDKQQCSPACQRGQCCSSSTGTCTCLSSSFTPQPCSNVATRPQAQAIVYGAVLFLSFVCITTFYSV